MDKSVQEVLLECQTEVAALKERLSLLEEKIAGIQAQADVLAPEAEAEEVDFTDVQLGGDIEVPSAGKQPLVETAVVEQKAVAETVVDTSHFPWRKDRPGIQVKNIRSGISLLDRALFIGTLFKEDFALYDNTVAALNEMENLEQAVSYVLEHFPDWNLGSDVVYRFMMAVRKKLG